MLPGVKESDGDGLPATFELPVRPVVLMVDALRDDNEADTEDTDGECELVEDPLLDDFVTDSSVCVDAGLGVSVVS
jgi:hypothetical protein